MLGENPKDRLGALKVPLRLVPKAGMLLVAKVMELGANKYGAYNWRENAVKESVYIEAAQRHLILAECGEDEDEESKQSHYAHVAACMFILMDAKTTGNLIDDRSKAVQVSALLGKLNRTTDGTEQITDSDYLKDIIYNDRPMEPK